MTLNASLDDYKYLFKVVLIGNAGVGKTCLVRRFTQGLFPPGQGSTIGVDFMIKTLRVNGDPIKLQIWDTAGQERFRSITQSYYRSANALILVYDVSNQPSFDCLPQWVQEIETYAGENTLTYLVGNKCDVESKQREVPEIVASNFAHEHNMTFLETSAKDADNVEQLFCNIAKELTQECIRSGIGSYHAAAADARNSLAAGSTSANTASSSLASCCKS